MPHSETWRMMWRFTYGLAELAEVERWIYADADAEAVLGAELYLRVIEYDFRAKDASYQIRHWLKSRYEDRRPGQLRRRWLRHLAIRLTLEDLTADEGEALCRQLSAQRDDDLFRYRYESSDRDGIEVPGYFDSWEEAEMYLNNQGFGHQRERVRLEAQGLLDQLASPPLGVFSPCRACDNRGWLHDPIEARYCACQRGAFLASKEDAGGGVFANDLVPVRMLDCQPTFLVRVGDTPIAELHPVESERDGYELFIVLSDRELERSGG